MRWREMMLDYLILELLPLIIIQALIFQTQRRLQRLTPSPKGIQMEVVILNRFKFSRFERGKMRYLGQHLRETGCLESPLLTAVMGRLAIIQPPVLESVPVH